MFGSYMYSLVHYYILDKEDGLTTDRLLNLLQGMPALLYHCTIVFPFGRSNRFSGYFSQRS